MKKFISLLLAVLMVVSLFAGCGGSSAPAQNNDVPAANAPAANAPAAEAPAVEEKKEPIVLNMALNSAWADLIPYNSSSAGNVGNLVIGLLHDHLYAINIDGTFGPRGADSWELSEDKTVLTFHLNKNAKWHDGTPVTAHDYVFAVEMITHPECAANEKNYYYILTGTDDSGNADGTELGVKAIDDHTLEYTFDRIVSPAVDFTLFMQHYIPLPKHILGDVAPADYLTQEFWNAPIGSGPLKFEATVAGSSLTLVANEDYQLGAPKFDKLQITVMNSDSSVPALMAGDLDVIFPAPSYDNFTAMEGMDNLSYYYSPYATSQKCIYPNNNWVSDARVRKAMDLAIDREAVAEMLGNATPIETPVHTASPFLDPAVTYTYDPDAARALLEEAIADGGYNPNEPLIFATNGAQGEMIASFVMQCLQAVGFNIEVQLMESTTMFSGLKDGSVDMGTITKSSALNPMYMQTALSDKRQSYIGWQTPLWDEIADEFMNAKDEAEEMAIMKKFQETWVEVVPAIFMVAQYENYAYSNRIGDGESLGLETAQYGCLPVWEWNVKG